jgi:hypothetical protein
MIEIDDDTVLVDADGFAAVVGDEPSDADRARQLSVLPGFREVVELPLLRLDLLSASADHVLFHQAWVDDERLALRLPASEDRWQLLVDEPGFLAAALARMVELNPNLAHRDEDVAFPAEHLDDLFAEDLAVRQTAFDRVGADIAWQLDCESEEFEAQLVAVDGARGPALYAFEDGAFAPTTNSEVFRMFTSLFEELMSE